MLRPKPIKDHLQDVGGQLACPRAEASSAPTTPISREERF